MLEKRLLHSSFGAGDVLETDTLSRASAQDAGSRPPTKLSKVRLGIRYLYQNKMKREKKTLKNLFCSFALYHRGKKKLYGLSFGKTSCRKLSFQPS